jgi:hypothetical protein
MGTDPPMEQQDRLVSPAGILVVESLTVFQCNTIP